ncbi:MAG: hypothetical protein GEU88_11310 [Solirubrobacterales bacterium]|nr:hypothetical protein [Solirubrobacterales bacterium]
MGGRSIGVELGGLLRAALVVPARLVRGAYGLVARHVTPARAVGVVALVALASLAASQWLDYRAISIGTDAYAGGIGVVAPAPEVDRVRAGDAHSWVMLPIALGGLACLALALWRRPALARLLALLGAAVIAIAVLVDAPRGLDEGATAVAYQGAEAHLLQGFWLQIAAGSVLIVCGLLLPAYMRPAPAMAPT